MTWTGLRIRNHSICNAGGVQAAHHRIPQGRLHQALGLSSQADLLLLVGVPPLILANACHATAVEEAFSKATRTAATSRSLSSAAKRNTSALPSLLNTCRSRLKVPSKIFNC